MENNMLVIMWSSCLLYTYKLNRVSNMKQIEFNPTVIIVSPPMPNITTITCGLFSYYLNSYPEHLHLAGSILSEPFCDIWHTTYSTNNVPNCQPALPQTKSETLKLYPLGKIPGNHDRFN